MGSTQWITAILCPLLGVLISNAMWLSPLSAILQARKDRDLGTLNPMPFGSIVVNCIGWVIYAGLERNYFIFFANSTGLCFGIFFCLTAMQLLTKPDHNPKDETTRFYLEMIVVGGIAGWLVVMLFAVIVFGPGHSGVTIAVGSLCDVGVIIYYSAPLSTMLEVIRTKDASSLHTPTIAINLVNGLMWFFYGLLGVPDINVWLPNGIGALLSVSQLMTAFFYRSTSGMNSPKKSQSDSISSIGSLAQMTTSISKNNSKSDNLLENDHNGNPSLHNV